MAAKKRPSKSAPRPRVGGARKAHVPPPAPAPRSAPSATAPGRSFPYGLTILGLIVVGGLVWWSMKHRDADSTPAPAVAEAAVPQAAATSVPNPVVAQPKAAMAEAEPRLAHRHHHKENSGESGGGTLTLSLKSRTPLRVSCWSANGAPARLDIFTRRNRRIRSVLGAPGTHGWQTLVWDGRDQEGALVPKGEYYARPSQKGDQMILDLTVKN